MTIFEYLDDLGIQYFTKGKNVSKGYIGIQCPFCTDHSNHLGIKLDGSRIYCWKCGGKSLISLIQTLSDCSYREAKLLSESLIFDEIHEQEERKIITDIELMTDFFSPLSEPYRKYLELRKFDPDEIEKKYLLHYAKIYSRYRYRLIIPIIMSHRIIAFTARDITGKSKIRYNACMNPLLPRSSWVYNLDRVKNVMVIVEGPVDVWRIGDGSVAMMGTGFSNGQIEIIARRKPSRVFIIFDADDEAQKRAMNLSCRLSAILPSVEIIDIGHGDPGDMTEDDVRMLRRELRI